MGTWHEDMMRSSDSFRECHENRGGSEPVPVVIVDDYISVTNQGGNNYWSVYSDPEKTFEVGKTYLVTIENNTVKTKAVQGAEHVELRNELFLIKYNANNNRFLIDYYAKENIGSNPTVYFKIEETKPHVPTIFYVTATEVFGTNSGISLDCTFEEITTKFENGDIPIIVFVGQETQKYFYLSEHGSFAGDIGFLFKNGDNELRIYADRTYYE